MITFEQLREAREQQMERRFWHSHDWVISDGRLDKRLSCKGECHE